MKSAPRRNTLAGYLDQLADSEKHKARAREAALEGMVQELARMLKRDEEFLESNRMSLVDQCLRVVKKGRSAAELLMAARAIGLVAMILDDMDAAHEIYRDSAPKLFDAVKSSSSKLKPPAQVLECLAVLTFFGGYLSEHRLESMAMIWACFFHDSSDGKKKEHSPELVAAAVSSWCFILSSDHCGISRAHWLTAIPCFFHLLGHDNESVVLAAAEALALVFEIDSLMSVPNSAAVDDNGGARGESSSSSSSSSSHPSKHDIAKKLNERMLAMEATDDEEGKEQQENIAASRLALVARFFEEGSSCKSLEVTRKEGVMLTTWSERSQMAFLEGFLGRETLAEHIKVNKQLQSMFKSKMAAKKKLVGEKPTVMAYDVEREEVKSRLLYKPELKWKPDEDGSLYTEGSKQRLLQKKLTQSPASWLSKARTQHMKKLRQVAATDRSKNVMDPDYD
ncbi:unnamed protein product [Linum tenue]|uniref:Interferon-related developmental regulator N-terminal domain-containing protein n=2 Tax=Linum tenue TaxID=586396 RepID=A0AAV0HQ82_9ROSI|nr:unnamed protein product [Linum tenue]